MDNRELKVFAAQIRLETVKELAHLGSGHIGGCMSLVELLAVLYGDEMRYDPKRPDWPERDKLSMSKGHAGPVLYATLALRGFFPMETLLTLNEGGTSLPSHTNSHLTPGVDVTTGSLGQGLSPAIGIAMGDKLMGRDTRVYCVLGDGECDEGQVWEAAAFAGAHHVSNLTAFVDLNKQQLDGWTKDVLDMGDMTDKFASFGWEVRKVDGHDVAAIKKAIDETKDCGRPAMIILDTVKGKNCPWAEQHFPCHHLAFSAEDIAPSVKYAEELLEKARRGE